MICNLDFYIQYAKSVLDDLSIPYDKSCPISFMAKERARVLGHCHREWNYAKNGYDFDITINPVLFASDNIDDTCIVETVIHELIHTCKDAFCHTGKFTYYAEKVNNRYHFNIGRFTDATACGVEMPWKYKVVCMGCNKVVQKTTRKTGLIKAAEKCGCETDTVYKHDSCGCKKFKVIYNR